MSKYAIAVGVSTLFIYFLGMNQKNKFIDYKRQPTISEAVVTLEDIQEIIQQQRKLIEEDFRSFTHFHKNKKNYNLDDFSMERGGTPLKNIILTSWRSGSTFLGEIINAHPANYFHVEPLVDFGYIQIRNESLAKKALKNIENLLKCNYSKMDHYLSYGKLHFWIFSQNSRLWKQCLLNKSICWNPQFLSRFCQLFPFQSMKLVRLRLRFIEKILTQKRVKVVYLVRDPRGTLQSRKHNLWCLSNPDCSKPKLLCSDLVSDFKTAIEFSKKYPHRFRVVRYEDLSTNPYEYSKSLYKFYGLDFNPSVAEYLDTHTKSETVDPYSTFRNSKTTPFHWRLDLNFSQVQEIQQDCSLALKLWGYIQAANATHQRYFNPTTNLVLKYPDNFDVF